LFSELQQEASSIQSQRYAHDKLSYLMQFNAFGFWDDAIKMMNFVLETSHGREQDESLIQRMFNGHNGVAAKQLLSIFKQKIPLPLSGLLKM
jgi:hypothetical protein